MNWKNWMMKKASECTSLLKLPLHSTNRYTSTLRGQCKSPMVSQSSQRCGPQRACWQDGAPMVCKIKTWIVVYKTYRMTWRWVPSLQAFVIDAREPYPPNTNLWRVQFRETPKKLQLSIDDTRWILSLYTFRFVSAGPSYDVGRLIYSKDWIYIYIHRFRKHTWMNWIYAPPNTQVTISVSSYNSRLYITLTLRNRFLNLILFTYHERK